MNKLAIFIVLTGFIISCAPSDAEKKQALKSFLDDDFSIKDTVIRYELDTNRLVLEFTTKTAYPYWLTEAGLIDPETNQEIYLGGSDKAKIVDNKIIFTGFSVPPRDLKNYEPWFFGFPYMENEWVISVPFGNIRIMYRKQSDTENILSPDFYSRRSKYVKFNMNVLDTLSPELVAYCEQEVLKRFKLSISDVEK